MTETVDVLALVPMVVEPGETGRFIVQSPWPFELGGHGAQFLVIPREIARYFVLRRIVVGLDDMLICPGGGAWPEIPAALFIDEQAPSMLRGVVVPLGRQVVVWARNDGKVAVEFRGTLRGRRIP